jgi:putative glutamine amidotransferase
LKQGHIVVVGQWREGQGGRVPAPYLEAVRAAGGGAKLFSTFDHGPGQEVPPGFEAVTGLDPDDDSPMDGAIGLVLPGGGDIDPAWYGQERHPLTHNLNGRRDRFEHTLLNEALHHDVPVLAVCHGMQLLNVVLGGSLCQHLGDDPVRSEHDSGYPGPEPVHGLRVKERSPVARFLGTPRLEVNSHHHQGIDVVSPVLEEVAWADDGVLEAMMSREHSWVVGVQWHPEVMVAHHKPQAALFRAFVEASEGYARRAARESA